MPSGKWKVDTVQTTVEVIRPEIKFKEVFKVLPGDTVIRVRDNYIQKIIKLPGDSVIVETIVKADTVYTEVPTYITRTVSAGYTQWELIGSVFGALLFAGLMAFGAYKLAGLASNKGPNRRTS